MIWQFDLATGRLVGAEVLLRLTLGDANTIPPSCFIPVAESTGQIIEITQWMIRRVCRQLCAWDGLGLAQIPLSVNVSAVELSQPHLAARICTILKEEGVEPHRLHLEITETAIARQEHEALANLEALRTAGFAIWIDDFGTGYSSLKSIRRYPVSGIKLDREFVQDLDRDPAARAIIRAILCPRDHPRHPGSRRSTRLSGRRRRDRGRRAMRPPTRLGLYDRSGIFSRAPSRCPGVPKVLSWNRGRVAPDLARCI